MSSYNPISLVDKSNVDPSDSIQNSDEIVPHNLDENSTTNLSRKRSRSVCQEKSISTPTPSSKATKSSEEETLICQHNLSQTTISSIDYSDTMEDCNTRGKANLPDLSTNARVKSLRLEAIFHPKFDNENLNNQDIRSSVLENVGKSSMTENKSISSNGENGGYLEVTLKHSGSLLLWSGGKRYYSKNSTNNIFTSVGEFLLRQHFLRAWGDDNTNENTTTTKESSVPLSTSKYQECSDYIEKNRLTLSFEVVTSIMGHHGDIPNQDYLLLLSVADRNRGSFYDSCQLLQFAQTFRLPHNDVWIYTSLESCEKLFHLYDTSREDGLADSVVATLNDTADGGHVLSMCPHLIFQGNILEGIVIRYVPFAYQDNDSMSEREIGVASHHISALTNLCKQSVDILKMVPPSRKIIVPWSMSSASNNLLCTDVRDLRRLHENDDTFQSVLRDVLDAEEYGITSRKRKVTRVASERSKGKPKQESDQSDKPNLDLSHTISEILSQENRKSRENNSGPSFDAETIRIATLIHALDKLNIKVAYNVWREDNTMDAGENTVSSCTDTVGERYICIVHVMHDSGFQKYHRSTIENKDAMLLYRGFSFEITFQTSEFISNNTKVPLSRNADETKRCSESMNDIIFQQHAHSTLMLKMKFLPYMVRTFICRNGMKILFTSGPEAFIQYAFNQFDKWKISQNAIYKWMPFIRGWSAYCVSDITKKATDGNGVTLSVPLTEANYLYFLDHYNDLYSSGSFNDDIDGPSESNFIGLAVIVGTNKDEISRIAQLIAKKLCCSEIFDDVNALTKENMYTFVNPRRGGAICTAVVSDGVKNIRLLAKEFQEQIHVIGIGCSEKEIEQAYWNYPQGEKKKFNGISNAWKKGRYGSYIDISRSSFFQDSDDHGTIFAEDSGSLSELVDHLVDKGGKTQSCDGPGILVFFPGIPGCGKSTLSSVVSTDSLNITNGRKIIMLSGDKVKKKYYPLLEKEKSITPSSVLIADKNAPPAAWRSISDICLKTQSIPVAIVPDNLAVTTTRVSDTMKTHQFPFSLHFLAVCIHRILQRTDGSHAGKLDAGTQTACMIVVKFFCLYHNMTAEQYIERLNFPSGAQSVLRIPFFSKATLSDLPEDLKKTLCDAIMLQMSMEHKVDEEMNRKSIEMDKRLRKLLESHAGLISDIVADEADSRQSFNAQLTCFVLSLDTSLTCSDFPILAQDQPMKNGIKIVSVDIELHEVYSVLNAIAKQSSMVANLLDQVGPISDGVTDGNSVEALEWVQNTHVTMMHCNSSSQLEMNDSFKNLIDSSVEIKVNSFIFSNKIAALSVSILPFTLEERIPIPESSNTFPHITTLLGKGIRAHESNNLPGQVEQGLAQKVNLEKPLVLKGKIAFWPFTKGSKSSRHN